MASSTGMASRGPGVKSSTARCVIWQQACAPKLWPSDGVRGGQVPARSRALLLSAQQLPIASPFPCGLLPASGVSPPCTRPGALATALLSANLSPCPDSIFSLCPCIQPWWHHPTLDRSAHALPAFPHAATATPLRHTTLPPAPPSPCAVQVFHPERSIVYLSVHRDSGSGRVSGISPYCNTACTGI